MRQQFKSKRPPLDHLTRPYVSSGTANCSPLCPLVLTKKREFVSSYWVTRVRIYSRVKKAINCTFVNINAAQERFTAFFLPSTYNARIYIVMVLNLACALQIPSRFASMAHPTESTYHYCVLAFINVLRKNIQYYQQGQEVVSYNRAAYKDVILPCTSYVSQ